MRTPDLFDLHDQIAIVTGGGRGIGMHIAIGLAEAGARVFIASRKIAACEKVAQRIRDGGGNATAIQTDVANPDSADTLVQTVMSEAGRIDVLVNNAAIVWAAPTLDYPLAGWDKVFGVNVRGLFYLSQQVARQMKDAGGGSIVHISSISAWRGSPDEEQPVVAYNASKGAVISLTIDMAVKLAPLGIRVNCIAPGPFDTDMLNHIRTDEEQYAAYNAQRPLGRSGSEDDIKGAVVFLVSAAANFITGQTLVVDGGSLCVGA